MLKRTGAALNGVCRVVSHFARPFPAKTPQPIPPLTHHTPPLYHRPAGGIHRPYKYFCFGVASKVGTSNYATSMGGMVDVSRCWVAMGDKEQNLAHLIESTSGRRLRIESENATSSCGSEEELSECAPDSRAGGLFRFALRWRSFFLTPCHCHVANTMSQIGCVRTRHISRWWWVGG